MDKKLKSELLKKGGKKRFKEYCALMRVPTVPMNMGTRVHKDKYHDKKCVIASYMYDY